MADNEFGGRITFDFAGLRLPPTDADIVLDVTNITTELKANQDGSTAYMSKVKVVGADIKLRNIPGVDWNVIMRKQGNATISETENGRTHLFTGTKLVGTPKENLSTGEVDGLRLEGGAYQRV